MKILIFGTVYAADAEAARLAQHWVNLHWHINPGCDLLLVDSNSPKLPRLPIGVLQTGHNIGHLSRGGGDGWGRAFCAGLQHAINRHYDYVVHIEGDSLCRLDAASICNVMLTKEVCATSVPVTGLWREERGWVETGLMFFDVDYLRDNAVIGHYDWKNGAAKKYPHTPEYWMHSILGEFLEMANWRTIRDDRKIVTVDNVQDYDWVSHVTPEVSDAYVASLIHEQEGTI